LHLGTWEDGRLVYRGKVGTGFTDAVLRDLRRRLDRIERKTRAFEGGPRGAAVRGTHWVEPVLVAQVRYSETTKDGRLRHPSFEGLREDKPASEVGMEKRVSSGRPAKTSKRRTSTSKAKRSKRSGQRAGGGAQDVAGVRLTSPEKVL